jgi:ABC-type methionine transport system ATPase subunit
MTRRHSWASCWERRRQEEGGRRKKEKALFLLTSVCEQVLILHEGRVVAHDSVTRLREPSRAASLEQVFATLAVNQDVDRIGRELAEVAAS